MTALLTPWSTGLLELAETLTEIGADDDLQGTDWLTATLVAFAESPFLHELDPFLYEVLLAWAGFDLARPVGLHAAAFVTAMLGGGGYLSLLADTDEPCAVWELATSPTFESQWADGAEFAQSDEGLHAFEVATERAGRLFVAYFTQLADDEQFPEAA